MNAASQGFWLPKAGNSDADYEDAFAIGSGSVAIADGATESSFARAWAEALVEGFTAQSTPDAAASARSRWSAQALQERIAPLQRSWHDRIAWERLPWFAEDKARSGAFSTLLVFQFMPAAEGAIEAGGVGDALPACQPRWEALAIGDSCLFQIRNDTLQTAFPLERAEQFNSRPVLLSSNPSNNDAVWETAVVSGAEYQPGDIFLFATDALAHWILAEHEAGRRPWQTLCALQSQADFADLITRLRQNRAIRNDDVTLVRLLAPTSGAVADPTDTASEGVSGTVEVSAVEDRSAEETAEGPTIELLNPEEDRRDERFYPAGPINDPSPGRFAPTVLRTEKPECDVELNDFEGRQAEEQQGEALTSEETT